MAAEHIPRFLVVINGDTQDPDPALGPEELRNLLAHHREVASSKTIAVYALQSAEQRETTFKSLI